jgi:ABC-type branched-subunit amino acid transport system permease subunit
MILKIDDNMIGKIQVVLISLLVFGAVAYVALGAYIYGFESTEGRALWSDVKLIVIAGVLASFAVLGLGRRVASNKSV